ncbi:MAG: enoyl-ACP reductase [Acidobacteriota bacterium]|nr:enoyl-ACP reductase [Blastocatellia bacterium]MDW8239600.1 enoyl-ACP reductase [Acidobacteriota bacterium]
MMNGKIGIVFGVANKRSIAWAIAQALGRAGARLVITYQNERFADKVSELAKELDQPLLLPCDVTEDAQLDHVFSTVEAQCGGLDFLVHSIAYAPREDLEGDFVDTSREGFRIAHDISVYSLIAMSRRAAPLMEKRGGGSIITMTYLGGERAVPNYNVMGVAKAALESTVQYLALYLGPKNIRVNAISAGPIKTLAASGVSGFSQMLNMVGHMTPLKRNIEPAEVGDTALFLCSDLSRGITGEVIHVDAGYHIVGVPDLALFKKSDE